MSREILFRGKKVENGEWAYGFLTCMNYIDVFNPKVCYDGQEEIRYYTVEHHQVDTNTVGQFTGLCDKNGNKIFEGDILLKGFEKVSVKWNENQCRWGIYSNDYEICGFNESTQGYFEVIGNIYDNPELLEVEQ